MSDIKKIIDHAKKNKQGFTALIKDGKIINVKGTDKHRYSIANRTSIVFVPKTKQTTVYFKPKNNTYVGGWYDKETGKYLIESINLTSNREKALIIARKRKQKAIFDLLKMQEIGLTYKQKVSGIRIRKDINVIIKKNKRYYNTITKKYVSKDTAKRLNDYFKKHPGATIYEASGRPIYDKDKPWIEQSIHLHRMLKKRKLQVVKTKDRYGKDVYFSPMLGKRVSKKQVTRAMKYDYYDGQFHVQLYRMTARKDRVYHLITTDINKLFEEHDDVDRLFARLDRTWVKDALETINRTHRKFPLSKNVTVIYVAFDHEIYITNYSEKDSGAVIIMKNRQPGRIQLQDFIEELERARMQYHAILNNYRLIRIKKIRIFMYCFTTQETKHLAELRLGVYNRNGD